MLFPAKHAGALPDISFQSPIWLPGGHAQTIYPALWAPKPKLVFRRERWTTPDQDFIDIDFLDGQVGQPWVVMFHGLEGSSQSHYALSTARACQARGLNFAVPHFRGCSGQMNLSARTYHAGETLDMHWVLSQLAARTPQAKRFAIGVSLGGNALIKWMGEQGQAASHYIHAAAAFCPPQDLQQGAISLAKGFNLIYMRNFLSTLKVKALAKAAQHPGALDVDKIKQAKNFFDLDEHVVARLFHFKSCYDYWEKSSCKQFLSQVRIPTLVVNPLNDPFLPSQFLAKPHEVSHDVNLYYPKQGGHVGFLQGGVPGNLGWLPNCALRFFDHG